MAGSLIRLGVLATSCMILQACDSRGSTPQGSNFADMTIASNGLMATEPVPPPPPPPPNYAPAIEQVLHADSQTGSHGMNESRVVAMRSIDLSLTPIDFRQAYLEHIFAWERSLRADQAWKVLTTEENNRDVAIGGIVCAVLNCPENPIDTRLEAEQRLREEMRLASEAINSTFRDVQRIAVSYGANPSVVNSGM